MKNKKFTFNTDWKLFANHFYTKLTIKDGHVHCQDGGVIARFKDDNTARAALLSAGYHCSLAHPPNTFIATSEKTVAVGDRKQAIYGFKRPLNRSNGKRVALDKIQIPDVWNYGKTEYDKNVIECWHLAHDMRNELISRESEYAALCAVVGRANALLESFAVNTLLKQIKVGKNPAWASLVSASVILKESLEDLKKIQSRLVAGQ